MEEKEKIKGTSIEVMFNVYDKFINFCIVEHKTDGDVIYRDVETGEIMDLESYAIHGYKLLRDQFFPLNRHREYTKEELLHMEETYNEHPKKVDYESKDYIDLNYLQDKINDHKYDYDLRYPVEQIEIRYSEILNDFLILYVRFNPHTTRFMYMDLCSGKEVDPKILELYTYYPRDGVLRQPDYSPREIAVLRSTLNKNKGQTKRLFK